MFNFEFLYLICIGLGVAILIWELSSNKMDKLRGIYKNSKQQIRLVGKKGKRSLGKQIGKFRKRNLSLSMKDRKKSPYYMYSTVVSSALISLHLQAFTNPESIFILFTIASIVIGFVITLQLALVVRIATMVVLFLFFHALLMFFSRSVTMRRLHASMDAEDLLASNMESGIVEAVTNNISSIDSAIRPIFQDFLNDFKTNMSIEDCIIRLNMKLGPMFDSFCENALIHYQDNDPATLNAFKDNIKKNAKRRILLNKQEIQYKEAMFIYSICIAISVAFNFIVASMTGMGILYFTSLIGRTLLILFLIVIISGFIVSQLLYSGGVE